MTRRELAMWNRAYQIADAATRRQCIYDGRHRIQPEGDPLAAHLLAEAIVQLAVATNLRTLSDESLRSATTYAAPTGGQHDSTKEKPHGFE